MFVDNRDMEDVTNFSDVAKDRSNTKDCSTCERGKSGECTKYDSGECGIFNNFSLWQ
jgi:hypothetical protein